MNWSFAFRAGAGTVAVAFVVAGAAVARTQATAIQLTGTLSAAQEVPAPTGDVSAARGSFTATATRTNAGVVLAWRLIFSGLSGPSIGAHIHVAPRGEAGPVTVPLCGPCESGASGTGTAVPADTVSAIQAGRAYVNVHTPANPAGEIRSQLSVVATTRATLNSRQEVPRPKGKVGRATGAFTATVTKSGPSGVLSWRLSFTRLTGRAVAAHIHIGPRGRAGGVALPLCAPCRSGATGRANVSAALLTALEAGRAYVNVHTARNPGGEIRGQLPAVPLSVSTAAGSAAGGGGGYDDP